MTLNCIWIAKDAHHASFPASQPSSKRPFGLCFHIQQPRPDTVTDLKADIAIVIILYDPVAN